MKTTKAQVERFIFLVGTNFRFTSYVFVFVYHIGKLIYIEQFNNVYIDKRTSLLIFKCLMNTLNSFSYGEFVLSLLNIFRVVKRLPTTTTLLLFDI